MIVESSFFENSPNESSANGECWSIEDSSRLFDLASWGEPYFSINDQGHVTVHPKGEKGGTLDLMDLVNEMQFRNLKLPLLIRFDDILLMLSQRSSAFPVLFFMLFVNGMSDTCLVC